jgi:O-antigen/teichoic acid export membrane protein
LHSFLKQDKSFRFGSFFKSTLILISGTAASQIIALLFQIVLRRLFSPELFGAFALYLSIFSILAVISSLKYEMAIVIPDKMHHAFHLCLLCFLLSFLYCSLLFIIFLLFKNALSELLSLNLQYSHWLLLLPFSLLFFGFYQAVNFWLIRMKSFGYASVNKIVRRTSEGTGQSSAGLWGLESGLPWGHLLGNISFNLTGIYQLRRTGFFSYAFDFSVLKDMISRFSNFPKYQASSHLLNMLSLMLPVVIVNILYSQEITGYLDLTRQVMAIPLALISTSVSQVLIQDVSEKKHQGLSIKKRIANTLLTLITLTLPGIFIILMWGEGLFSFVFGSQWSLSGKIAQILVFAYAIKFIVSPLSAVLTALEKLKTLAIWRTTYFIAILCLFLLQDTDMFLFFKIYMAIEIVFYGIYLVLIWRGTLTYDRSLK